MQRGALMEEQIRREGAWASDLTRPVVARVFFELPDGTCHPGMFVESLQDALHLVLEFGLTVPRAFVTLRDEVILDVQEGVLDFPDDAKPVFDEAKARFPSWNTKWLETGSLGKWTRSRCVKLLNAARAYAKASGFDGSAPEAYDHRVNRLEHELQSVAAQFGLDLFRFGYQVPGVVCAQLERFDVTDDLAVRGGRNPTNAFDGNDNLNSGHSQSGSADSNRGPNQTDQTVDQSTVFHRVREPDAFDTLAGMVKDAVWKPRIARIWWSAIAIYWPLATLLVVLGLVEINLFLVVIGMVLSPFMLLITLMAWALTPEQPISQWRRDAWTGELDRELNPHLSRDGRTPRSMDPSDPASGNFWIGNHGRQQVLKDEADRRGR
jgi:hypothetical protein